MSKHIELLACYPGTAVAQCVAVTVAALTWKRRARFSAGQMSACVTRLLGSSKHLMRVISDFLMGQSSKGPSETGPVFLFKMKTSHVTG